MAIAEGSLVTWITISKSIKNQETTEVLTGITIHKNLV
jgi:hypothetical protein